MALWWSVLVYLGHTLVVVIDELLNFILNNKIAEPIRHLYNKILLRAGWKIGVALSLYLGYRLFQKLWCFGDRFTRYIFTLLWIGGIACVAFGPLTVARYVSWALSLVTSFPFGY